MTMLRRRLGATLFTLGSVGAITMSACGGAVDMSACRASEAPVGPYTIPFGPTFQVAYGTAFTQKPLEGTFLNVLLTEDPNGCPTGWVWDYSTKVTSDTFMLWISVPAPADGIFPANWVNPNTGSSGLYVLAGIVPQGQSYYWDQASALAEQPTVGNVTITRFVDGSEIAGNFVITFEGGQSVSGEFDVPFCACPDP